MKSIFPKRSYTELSKLSLFLLELCWSKWIERLIASGCMFLESYIAELYGMEWYGPWLWCISSSGQANGTAWGRLYNICLPTYNKDKEKTLHFTRATLLSYRAYVEVKVKWMTWHGIEFHDIFMILRLGNNEGQEVISLASLGGV